MTTNEKLSLLNEAYERALRSGLISNRKEFAEFAGITRTAFSSAMNGDDRYLTDSMVSKAIAAVNGNTISVNNSPHTSVATGNGQINIHPEMRVQRNSPDGAMVPVIPQHLYKEAEVNIVEYLESNKVCMSPAVHQFPKTTCFYVVSTDAMQPHFRQGDILALKKVSEDAPIVNGEVYAVDTVDLGILIRFAYDRGDYLEMCASETASRYESFKIKKSDIYTLFRVVGLIRTNI